MSPRFPQELFDYIIDNAHYDRKVLKACSTVCKSWTTRSRSHLFELLQFSQPLKLEKWCKGIPPTIDGPSRHVKRLYLDSEDVSFAGEPQSSDPCLDHFTALTQVIELTLIGYDDKVHLDTVFRRFSGFKDTLTCLELMCTSFGFEEVSRIAEFFPNLETLTIRPPDEPIEESAFQPLRRATFPHLEGLVFYLSSECPALEHNLLSGFAEASMNLEGLVVLGPVSDISAVQKIVETSAQSLVYLQTSLLDLDLSAWDNVQEIVVENLLHSYTASLNFHDSLDRPRFERMLATIGSPTLCGITVRVETQTTMTWHLDDEDERIDGFELLPESDWTGVDAALCGLLVRARARAQDPLWTFEMRIIGCYYYSDNNPPDLQRLLPDFLGMGGVAVASHSNY